MAESKDDIKHATSQARHSEDEAVRVGYVHGTPLEAGKITDSEPVDLFAAARNISKSADEAKGGDDSSNQTQMRPEPSDDIRAGHESSTNSARFPKKTAPFMNVK